MANYEVLKSKHASLSTTNEDVVTVLGSIRTITVLNHDASNLLYFNVGAVDPGAVTSAADNSYCVPVSGEVTVKLSSHGAVVRLIGSGNAYSVQAIQ